MKKLTLPTLAQATLTALLLGSLVGYANTALGASYQTSSFYRLHPAQPAHLESTGVPAGTWCYPQSKCIREAPATVDSFAEPVIEKTSCQKNNKGGVQWAGTSVFPKANSNACVCEQDRVDVFKNKYTFTCS